MLSKHSPKLVLLLVPATSPRRGQFTLLGLSGSQGAAGTGTSRAHIPSPPGHPLVLRAHFFRVKSKPCHRVRFLDDLGNIPVHTTEQSSGSCCLPEKSAFN